MPPTDDNLFAGASAGGGGLRGVGSEKLRCPCSRVSDMPAMCCAVCFSRDSQRRCGNKQRVS